MNGLEQLLQASGSVEGMLLEQLLGEGSITLGSAMEGLDNVRQVYHDARLSAAKAAPDEDDDDDPSCRLDP